MTERKLSGDVTTGPTSTEIRFKTRHVYYLERAVDYEGGDCLGLFSTLKKAVTAAKERMADDSNYVWRKVDRPLHHLREWESAHGVSMNIDRVEVK